MAASELAHASRRVWFGDLGLLLISTGTKKSASTPKALS
jgi:hypothetical protein